MSHFAFRAATTGGHIVRGVEDAASPVAVELVLRRRGLYPIEVAERPAPTPGRAWRSARADVTDAVRHLATLVDAGFPLDRALGTAARLATRADVSRGLATVRDRVRGGAALADALDEHPRVFPRLAIGMARAGERGGQLADSLRRLAEQLEREAAVRAQLLSAATYPAVMMAVGGLALALLLGLVLPRFAGLIRDLGGSLPVTTAWLLAAGEFGRRWWPFLGGGLGLLIGAAVAAHRRPDSRLAFDEMLLRLPGIGALRRRAAAARLGRTLAGLLASGMPVLPALDVAADALTDTAVTRLVRQAREEVRAGSTLASALGRGGALPLVFLQMMAVGEESGRLPDLLDRAASAAEDELRRGLDRLVRLVEPTLIVVFGGVVTFVALALLQAIYGVRVDALP